jgi:hypothetical protein
MPYGTVTSALTAGQREALVLPSFALFPGWEFFVGVSLVWDDENRGTEDHFSTIINVKWEFYENDAKTGGVAMLLGTGARPGYLNQDKQLDSFNSFQYIVEATLPFLDGMISWDLNPGVLFNIDKDDSSVDSEWQFTYATRIAFYGIIPSSAIVGEVYGGIGAGESDPEYKAGIRWEPSQNLNVALTYGGGPGDERLPGLEIGVLVFSQLF